MQGPRVVQSREGPKAQLQLSVAELFSFIDVVAAFYMVLSAGRMSCSEANRRLQSNNGMPTMTS